MEIWVSNEIGLIPLWIYITLKLMIKDLEKQSSLIPLWIYITLKQTLRNFNTVQRLIPLWIYITLKPHNVRNRKVTVLYLYEFTLLSNLLTVDEYRK